jgi:UDP-galactopyranose mutase
MDVLIVGAGLSGCVLADLFARKQNKKVLILEKRDHIGGNCYDSIDEDTGILVSKYGPHFFHTNDEGVWDYVQQFGEWIRYDPKIVSYVDDRYVPVPVNMETINILCNTHLSTEQDTAQWLSEHQVPCNAPTNSKDVALSRVGTQLYESMFRPYTKKQWNREPEQLDPSVLSRIPVRHTMDSRYFTDKFQGVPKHGYTKLIETMLNHPNITVQLNTEFHPDMDISYKTLIYTGPIDSYYASRGLPKLEYRSLRFEREIHKNVGYVQPNIVVNYPSETYPYTRIVEYKHLPNNSHSKDSVLVKEYPCDEGEPYYPVPNKSNQTLYAKYQELAKSEPNVHMIGRLANYKYFNMDEAIRNAINYFDTTFSKKSVLAVIVRYKEPIEWVSNLKMPYFIINRGPPIDGICGINVENDSIGREASGYLSYIIHNYDTLPESLIFLQADPFPHQSRMLEFLEPDMISEMPPFQNLAYQYNSSIPCPNARHLATRYFKGIPYNHSFFDESMLPINPSYFDRGLQRILDSLQTYYRTIYPNTNHSLRRYIHTFFEIPYIENTLTPFGFCAMFKVDRERVYKHPKEYYIRIQNRAKENWTFAYAMERMWNSIFDTTNIPFSVPCEIVVAHYNEDLSWLNPFKHIPTYVYSKGQLSNIVCIQRHLPNIGRESHTYLSYILERYETLPDIVFFTQGCIHDHIPSTANLTEYIKTTYLDLNPNEFSSQTNYPERSYTFGLENYRRPWWGYDTEPSELAGDEWFRTFVDNDATIVLESCKSIFWSATFSLRKEAILSRSKEYYQTLLYQCETPNPETGHFFERSWFYIFNLHKLKT